MARRAGDMNFSMSQIYPFSSAAPTLAEESNPEASDQKALVDDQKTTSEIVGVNPKTKNGIFGAILAIVCVAFVLGVVKGD